MAIIQLSGIAQFHDAIRSGVSMVQFGTPWCAPCRHLTPILKRLDAQMAGKAIIYTIDVDQDREIALQYEITSIPTLIVFRNGEETRRFIGLKTDDMLSRAMENAMKQP